MSEPEPPAGSADVERRLEEILDRFARLLRGTIARICPPALGIDLDDVEQEARLRIWRALLAARELAHPASYVYRAAASAAVDALRRARARRQSRWTELSDAALDEAAAGGIAGRSPEERAAARQELAVVKEVLMTLDVDRRRAVGLHLRGFTTAEIGELLGWSEPKARSLVYRGLAEVRSRLAARGVAWEPERHAPAG
jgi:RNA polymerase sigma-70 factor (ECF subfamily)